MTIKPGTCTVCGCTELDACRGGCSWMTDDETLCSTCVALVDYIATHLHRKSAPSQGKLTKLEPGLNGLYWLVRLEMHSRDRSGGNMVRSKANVLAGVARAIARTTPRARGRKRA